MLPETLVKLGGSLHSSDVDQQRGVPHLKAYQGKNEVGLYGLSSSLSRIKQTKVE